MVRIIPIQYSDQLEESFWVYRTMTMMPWNSLVMVYGIRRGAQGACMPKGLVEYKRRIGMVIFKDNLNSSFNHDRTSHKYICLSRVNACRQHGRILIKCGKTSTRRQAKVI